MTDLIATANTLLVTAIFYFAAMTVNVFVDTYFTIKEHKDS
ncbi:hypothetical protein [Streptomyces luteogriseus]